MLHRSINCLPFSLLSGMWDVCPAVIKNAVFIAHVACRMTLACLLAYHLPTCPLAPRHVERQPRGGQDC